MHYRYSNDTKRLPSYIMFPLIPPKLDLCINEECHINLHAFFVLYVCYKYADI